MSNIEDCIVRDGLYFRSFTWHLRVAWCI